MKHAILETGSRTFIALEKGFHGKTLGAVQLTANQDYREPFEIAGLTVHRVRLNDVAHLEQTFARTGSIAGLIFEPIQGEGGVREITPAFAQRAAALCAARGAPLIADEIQSGMGRTGTFLASEALGVTPGLRAALEGARRRARQDFSDPHPPRSARRQVRRAAHEHLRRRRLLERHRTQDAGAARRRRARAMPPAGRPAAERTAAS